MGRRAGVSAEETRTDLLDAAARVFAAKGYDGASVADITAEAGLSSGSIYVHYGSKAELFVAVVQERALGAFAGLFGLTAATAPDDLATAVGDLPTFLRTVGAALTPVGPGNATMGPLLVEAVVAAKRHPEIKRLVEAWLVEGEKDMSAAVVDGQRHGVVDGTVAIDALSRFVLMVSIGARVLDALDLPEVGADGWVALIDRLVDAVRAPS